jgi:thiamine pyrophosphate-dependent acetolactate synthase large subunit-like protein
LGPGGFAGDGGFYYHIAELETARRHNINLVMLVNNNSSLNQEITLNKNAYNGQPRGGWKDMWTFTDINFAKIAEDFGCVGMRVETRRAARYDQARVQHEDRPIGDRRRERYERPREAFPH